jgi:predicted dinucleotide-binding enzyme
MRIGIIGKGNVGTALGTGLKRAGHEIKYGHRDPKEPVLEAARWGEVIIFAVPFSAVKEVASAVRSAVEGKPVIDVTNVLGPNDEWSVGFTTSGAEELQKTLPNSHVVKAFNTVFAQNQSTGRVGKEQLTAFVAGNNAKAKQIVMGLAGDIGFDPVDVGELKIARYLEPLGFFMINLGFDLKMGANIGLRLVKG